MKFTISASVLELVQKFHNGFLAFLFRWQELGSFDNDQPFPWMNIPWNNLFHLVKFQSFQLDKSSVKSFFVARNKFVISFSPPFSYRVGSFFYQASLSKFQQSLDILHATRSYRQRHVVMIFQIGIAMYSICSTI